jgi:hypothetical protein
MAESEDRLSEDDQRLAEELRSRGWEVTPPEAVETDIEDVISEPECDLCGSTECPDADLPEFYEPRECKFIGVYNELRYDRCDYGCGRDITKESVRRAVRGVVQAVSGG